MRRQKPKYLGYRRPHGSRRPVEGTHNDRVPVSAAEFEYLRTEEGQDVLWQFEKMFSVEAHRLISSDQQKHYVQILFDNYSCGSMFMTYLRRTLDNTPIQRPTRDHADIQPSNAVESENSHDQVDGEDAQAMEHYDKDIDHGPDGNPDLGSGSQDGEEGMLAQASLRSTQTNTVQDLDNKEGMLAQASLRSVPFGGYGFDEEYEWDTASAVPCNYSHGEQGGPMHERMKNALVKMDRDMKCSICMERNKDTILKCGHMFCLECLKQANKKTCVICSAEIDFREVIKMLQ